MTTHHEAELVTRWRQLLARHSTIACALDRALQESHDMGMSEFEVMDRLVDAGCEKSRMADLAAGMYLSQSALSRTVARLEREGYVERAMCHSDRRAIFVKLTEAGRARHAAARDIHRGVLLQHLTDTAAHTGA
jgi:DNA-binding MarR family transcriptional regulator